MSLVDSLMQPLRQEYSGQLDKFEMRQSRYAGYDLFQKQTNDASGILTPDVRSAVKKSFGNSVVIPVLNADSVTIGNVRSCTIADSENTSKLITLTFVTYAFGFTMTPAQHYNNDVKYQADFNQKLRKYLLQFASTLDTACINKLSTDKNIYWPSAITNIYSQTGNALQVSQAQSPDFYNNLTSIMETLDFYGNYDIVASTSHNPLVRRLTNQGANNNTNQVFQFNGYEWGYTNRLTNGAGIQSTVYVMPKGAVAMENRNDPDAVMGSKVGDAKIWSEVEVPLVNLKMGSYYTKDCSDRSMVNTGTTGLTRSLVEGFEWSTDVCYVTAYNSAPSTKGSPIIKAEISNT